MVLKVGNQNHDASCHVMLYITKRIAVLCSSKTRQI